MPKLGVNIDHVATLRQARREFEPDPLAAAKICEKAGADSIVCHLREDRRHINEKDVRALKKIVRTRLNLEMSLAPEIIEITIKIKPDEATLVPERRQEVTTEGGLDVVKQFNRVRRAVERMKKRGIKVNLFIDPVKKQIDAAKKSGADMIELHTGKYAQAATKQRKRTELNKLKKAVEYARRLGLVVNAGHGLKYHDTRPVARIKGIEELNIGHSIISRAVFTGLAAAVKEMRKLVK